MRINLNVVTDMSQRRKEKITLQGGRRKCVSASWDKIIPSVTSSNELSEVGFAADPVSVTVRLLHFTQVKMRNYAQHTSHNDA